MRLRWYQICKLLVGVLVVCDSGLLVCVVLGALDHPNCVCVGVLTDGDAAQYH
jgi:hypothetical protein